MTTPTEALKIARDALELASDIADRVPTRWHELNPSNSPAEHDIGCMVNAQPDGQHGYRLIHDALSAVRTALAQPQPSAPTETSGQRAAWTAVMQALDEVSPGWCKGADTPMSQAVAAIRWMAQPSVPSAEPPFDMLAHLKRQAEFSAKTFGPGARVEGVTDHIAKELREVRESGGDLSEWVDVIILAFDGAWRSGASPAQIIDAMVAKQTKNEGRKWPDWRTAPANKAIEHDRSGEVGPTPPPATATKAQADATASVAELFSPHQQRAMGIIQSAAAGIDSMRAEVWNAAIEAAALVVQPVPHIDEERTCGEVAAAIRALKSGTAPQAAPVAPEPVKADGRLHADGYFTWARRDGYAMDKKLPCDFYLAAPAAPAPAVQPLSEEAMKWRKAVQEAYGWLWHTNNEPMAPVPMWSPEQAAYQARKCLRELLTTAERGEAINAIAAHMDKIAGITAAPTKETP